MPQTDSLCVEPCTSPRTTLSYEREGLRHILRVEGDMTGLEGRELEAAVRESVADCGVSYTVQCIWTLEINHRTVLDAGQQALNEVRWFFALKHDELLSRPGH